MTIDLPSVTMYSMGVLGLLAVGWIPLRLLWSLRLWKGVRTLRVTAIKIFCGLSLLACLVAAVADAFIVVRLAACLTSYPCGGGIAAGWIHMALLGAVYLALEVALGILSFCRMAIEKRK